MKPTNLDDSSTASGEASLSSSGNQAATTKPAAKKKRNLPGMPDPEAEVVALSPKTLLATNRFVCEICNKGFQRDQNLQLHRRGHNLPWKLKQRSSKDVKKRVYVCPESSCVHHDPSRALGDLTGIKKHYCRKHGEKKWKCEQCSKKYAVQSDWKAHSKICGSREYRCDCGTLFSRRDSFITHRAFCDALAKESVKATQIAKNTDSEPKPKCQTATSSPPPAANPPLPSATTVAAPSQPSALLALSQSTVAMCSSLPVQTQELLVNPLSILEAPAAPKVNVSVNGSYSSRYNSRNNGSTSSSLFAPSTSSAGLRPPQLPTFTGLMRTVAHPDCPTDGAPSSSVESISLGLSTSQGSSFFGTAGQEVCQYTPLPQPAMSATALLQKAAQMGAAATSASLLRDFGILSSLPSSRHEENLQWSQRQIESDSSSISAGLGIGLPLDGSSGLKELMMETSSIFGPKQPTLDFLGLGMAAGGSCNNGLSALITANGGGLDVAVATTSFGGGEFNSKDIGRSS